MAWGDADYKYEAVRAMVFIERNQTTFLSIRDRVHRLLEEAGAFTMRAAIVNQSGCSFELMACVDRLAELGEIMSVGKAHPWDLDRVFTRKPRNESFTA